MEGKKARQNSAVRIRFLLPAIFLIVPACSTTPSATPARRGELEPLTNLVNLRTLEIWISDEYIKRVDTNIFSKLDKLTNCVITSDQSRVLERVWITPAKK